MALHTELEIYSVAFELLSLVTKLVANMPRDFKPTIGFKIRDEAIEILTLIFRANKARVKTPHLDDLIESIQVINILLRLSRQERWISDKGYSAAIKLTTDAGKQAGGWRKSTLSSAS